MNVERKNTEVTYTLTLSSHEAEMLRRLAGALSRTQINEVLQRQENTSIEYVDGAWRFIGALYQGLDYQD